MKVTHEKNFGLETKTKTNWSRLDDFFNICKNWKFQKTPTRVFFQPAKNFLEFNKVLPNKRLSRKKCFLFQLCGPPPGEASLLEIVPLNKTWNNLTLTCSISIKFFETKIPQKKIVVNFWIHLNL